MGQRSEQGFVEQLVSQATVEALDEPVLLGLARRDVVPANTGAVCPLQDGVGRVLRAVIADDRVRGTVRNFVCGSGIMGKKEISHGSTERPLDT